MFVAYQLKAVSLQPKINKGIYMTGKNKFIFVGIGAVTGAVMGAITTFMTMACVDKLKGALQNQVGGNVAKI